MKRVLWLKVCASTTKLLVAETKRMNYLLQTDWNIVVEKLLMHAGLREELLHNVDFLLICLYAFWDCMYFVSVAPSQFLGAFAVKIWASYFIVALFSFCIITYKCWHCFTVKAACSWLVECLWLCRWPHWVHLCGWRTCCNQLMGTVITGGCRRYMSACLLITICHSGTPELWRKK